MLEFLKQCYRRNLSSPAAAILLLQFITIFVIIYYFVDIVFPLLWALILAFMLDRPVSWMVKHKASRLNASIIVTLFMVVVVLSVFLTVIPPAINQLSKISTSITSSLNDINTQEIMLQQTKQNSDTVVISNSEANNKSTEITETENNTKQDIINSTQSQNINEQYHPSQPPYGVVPDADKLDATAKLVLTKVMEYKNKLPTSYKNIITDDQIYQLVTYSINTVKEWISPLITTQLAPFVITAFSGMMYFVIIPIFTFLMLKDKEKLISISKKYLTKNEEVARFWKEMNFQISKYLNGKLIHVGLISTLNGMAFAIYGLNYSLLLGIGVGLSVIIPYVGAVIITIPVIIVGTMQFGFTASLAWLLGIYLVIQLIDGYVVTPMLFSETLNLDSLSILVAIIIFGGIWGVWGVILAIPLATFIKTIFLFWPINNDKNNQTKLLN